MSLYLTVFSDKTEVDGWVFGHYSDFGFFRDQISREFSPGEFPLLMTHSDCDGLWAPDELPILLNELTAISTKCRELPAIDVTNAFEHTAKYREGATSLYDCFHNVDGENIFDALISLCELGISIGEPILFQ